MNCSGPSSQRFRETHKQTRKRRQLTANTHLGSTLCSPFHMKGSEKPSKSFRRLRLMWPLLSHKNSHLAGATNSTLIRSGSSKKKQRNDFCLQRRDDHPRTESWLLWLSILR